MSNSEGGSVDWSLENKFFGKGPGSSVKPEVLCRNNGDNAVACDLMKRLRVLRSDSDYHSELLGTLCLPRNRDAIRAGKKDDLDQLFSMIDAWRESHDNRLACIDRVQDATPESWLAWMVERTHPQGGTQYLTMTDTGSEWVDDPLIGLQFVRREDAERFAAGCDAASAIRQHEFVDPPWKGQGPTHQGVKP